MASFAGNLLPGESGGEHDSYARRRIPGSELARRGTRKHLVFARLKQSQFIVGLAKALRGLNRDLRVLVWLAKRNVGIAAYLKAHRVKKLQLGTSNNILDGWLNTDVVPNHGSVVYLDATRRFPFDDDTFDYIMSEHMIEHVEYQAAQIMLRECARVLKPGGRVRFATPDLQVLLALHSGEKTDAQKHYFDWAVERFLPGVQKCEASL